MEGLKERFPQDLDYRYSLDTTLPIEVGIEEILHTLLANPMIITLLLQPFSLT